MVPFGTITEKDIPQNKQLLGGKINITTLWGIPVYGHRKPIKESEKNLTIGYLWLSQDTIFGIAQMNDGKTFVGVIDDHQPNYIVTGRPHVGKTGPVWTWYSNKDIKDLKIKYGIPTPSLSTVKDIGIAKINRQRYKLYGIQLPEIGGDFADTMDFFKSEDNNVSNNLESNNSDQDQDNDQEQDNNETNENTQSYIQPLN